MKGGDEHSDIWTRYWQGGVLHSCGCAFSGNYEGATADFWRARFAMLGPEAVIVDIGTGNGAVPLLAQAAAQEHGYRWHIHGVDIAAIDPVSASPQGAERYAGIQFHPRTSATALPFEAASVDLLSGQYAFEYAPRAASLAEISRVVRRGGNAAFVLHSRDSVVVAAAPPQLLDARLLQDSEFFRHAGVLGALLAQASTPDARQRLARDPRAEAARRRFNRAAALLTERLEEAAIPDFLQTALGESGAVLQRAHELGVDGVGSRLQGCERALNDECQRLQDLVDAALDPSQATELQQQFLAAGFVRVDLDRLEHSPTQPMGWILIAQR